MKAFDFRKYGIFLVLLAVFLFFSFMSPAFFTSGNLLNVARQVSMIGIASVGMTFVMLTGGIDLSVGSQITFVNIFCAYLMVHLKVHPVLAVVIVLAITSCVGYVIGWLVSELRMPPFIATLGFMNILSGIAFIISGGLPIFGFPKGFSIIGQGYVGFIPIPVIIMVFIVGLGSFILNRTYHGRYFYAVGGNEEAAALSGIDVKLTKKMVYTLCGVFSGLAGVIMLSRTNSGQPTTGKGFEFDVIIAVVLGGVSTMGGAGMLSGAIAGVLIMGILGNGMILLNIGEFYQIVIKGTVLLLAVGFDCVQKYGAPTIWNIFKKRVVAKSTS